MSRRIIPWVSAGAASAVAAKLIIRSTSEGVMPVYCETGAEHPDNERFLTDCEAWFGQSIHRLRSEKFADTWAVWEARQFLAGVKGAPCTMELKVAPRLAFQRPDDVHVFGYTADRADIARAVRLRESYPHMTIVTPLIDRGITKEACLAMVANAGITLPPLYALGFQNNNCLPCVKATSPAYWALVRKHFPDKFQRMVDLSRALDVRLCRLDGERAFIDEIPADHPTTNPMQPSCDFLCSLAEMDLEQAQ